MKRTLYSPPPIAVFGLIMLLIALVGGAVTRGSGPRAVAAAPAPGLAAQAAGTLQYGRSTLGTINADSPLAIYTFNGTEGDLVNVQVVGTTPDMNPSIGLLDSTQQRLTYNNNDVFSPITGDATLSWFLPYTGMYLLVITDTEGQPTDFVLRLDGRPEVISPMLQPNLPVRVDIPAGSEEQFFRFEHQSQCFSTLTIIPETPEFPFTAHVRSERGESVAILRGGALREDRVTIPPNSGVYEIEVGAATPEAEGYVVLVLTCAEDAPFCDGAADLGPVDLILQGGTIGGEPVPDDTPTPTATQPPPDGGVTPPPPQQPNCGGFRLTSPRDGLPRGPITVYWDPAPSATGYQVTARNNDNGMTTGASVGAGTTSAAIDVGPGTLGEGFSFTITVVALRDGRVICSDSATMFREGVPGDDPGDEPDDGGGGRPRQCVYNNQCDPWEDHERCPNDCPPPPCMNDIC